MGNYDRDREFEKSVLPLYSKVLTDIVYPGSTIIINQDKHNSQTLDQEVSLDAFIKTHRKPHQSIQMKARRSKHYKYFRYNKDFLLNIGKIASNGNTYEGDYYKCQSNLFMYGYANGDIPETVTDLLYWAVIDYALLRNKFLSLNNGWRDIPGIKINNYSDKGIICHFIIIPWRFIEDCLISTSETCNSVLF